MRVAPAGPLALSRLSLILPTTLKRQMPQKASPQTEQQGCATGIGDSQAGQAGNQARDRDSGGPDCPGPPAQPWPTHPG